MHVGWLLFAACLSCLSWDDPETYWPLRRYNESPCVKTALPLFAHWLGRAAVTTHSARIGTISRSLLRKNLNSTQQLPVWCHLESSYTNLVPTVSIELPMDSLAFLAVQCLTTCCFPRTLGYIQGSLRWSIHLPLSDCGCNGVFPPVDEKLCRFLALEVREYTGMFPKYDPRELVCRVSRVPAPVLPQFGTTARADAPLTWYTLL